MFAMAAKEIAVPGGVPSGCRTNKEPEFYADDYFDSDSDDEGTHEGEDCKNDISFVVVLFAQNVLRYC